MGLYGTLVAVNGLIVIAAEIPVTRFVQHWPRRAAIPAAIALIAAGIAGFGLPGTGALATATCVWTAGEMIAAPSVAAYPTLVSGEEDRGRYGAVASGAQGLGYAVGPALGIAVWTWDAGSSWFGCLSLGTAAAVLARWGVRRKRVSAPPRGGAA
ncbi:MFS transporter [Actinomadura gamaensis]|uniref:MFS transporter n=1 Tax=Actinomadura gamaensis TaxID=1763541 RepID=A0ABV9U616_9ACTN